MRAHTQTSKLQTSKVHSDVVSVQAVIYLRLFSCYKNRIWLLSYLVIVENIHMMYVQHFQCTELHWPHRLKGGETSDLSEKKPTSTCRIWIHLFWYGGEQENWNEQIEHSQDCDRLHRWIRTERKQRWNPSRTLAAGNDVNIRCERWVSSFYCTRMCYMLAWRRCMTTGCILLSDALLRRCRGEKHE